MIAFNSFQFPGKHVPTIVFEIYTDQVNSLITLTFQSQFI